jgi:hypothetical protein
MTETDTDHLKQQKRERGSSGDVSNSKKKSSTAIEEHSTEDSQLIPVIKSQPNFVFASWLCSMVGQDRLREGSGVIDIAGGNGLLSFELTCRYGVPSTVLDPRQMKFNSILRRRMKKLTKNRLKDYMYHNSRVSASPSSKDGSDQVKCSNKSSSVKWDNCVIKVQDDYQVLERVKQAVLAESTGGGGAVGGAVGGGPVLPFQQYQVYFEGPQSPITPCRDADAALLGSASMFVGMHPGEVRCGVWGVVCVRLGGV